MALDPEIALGYRPPQVNVQVPQPLEQFGQVLNLQGLMQQQQLRQVQMQDIAAQMQQRQTDLENLKKFQSLYAPGQPEPTQAQIMGTLGPKGAETVRDMLANEKTKLQLSNDKLKGLSSYASTILNEPGGPNQFTYEYNIKKAVQDGYLTADQGDAMLQHSVSDPQVRMQLRAFLNNAMDATQQQTYAFNQADNAHKLITAGLEEEEKRKQNLKTGLDLFQRGIGQVTSLPADQQPAAWANFVANAPADVQKFYSGVKWGPETPGIVASASVTPEMGKTMPTPADVVTQQIRTEQGKVLAKNAAELQAYQPIVQRIMNGEQRLQDLPPDIQGKVGPGLILGGYTGFGKLISDAERQRLSDINRTTTILQQTLADIQDPKNQGLMGPGSGLVSLSPWGIETRKLRDHLVTQQQELKKFVTNGSLRGVTADTLDKMFPSIFTHPDEAKGQITDLLNTVAGEKNQYLRDLSDKVIPANLKPTAPTAPPQTPTAPGSPAPTPAASAGSAPPDVMAVAKSKPALPGKVKVVRPLGGGKWEAGYVNAGAAPGLARQGYVVVE